MRGARLASALLLTCLTLAACEDDPVGPVDPTRPTPSSTTTPTPTGPTPPPLPDAARASTAPGAAAFVTYYVSLMNYSAESGDTEAIEAVTKNCDLCGDYISLYKDLKPSGGYSQNPGWTPSITLSERTRDQFTVLADVRTGRYRFRRSSEASEQVAEPTTYKLIFTVDPGDGAPTMVNLEEQTAQS